MSPTASRRPSAAPAAAPGRAASLPGPARCLARPLALGLALALARPAAAQSAPAAARAAGTGPAGTLAAAPAVLAPPPAERVALSPGRVVPVTVGAAVTRVAVADTAVADVMVVSDRDVVFTGRRAGETDVLLWAGAQRRQFRVVVSPAADRPQVVLAVKFAEVRRDALRNVGVSFRYDRVRGANSTRSGTDALPTVPQVDATTRAEVLPRALGYFSVLTDLGTRDLQVLIDAEEQRGNARILAEPTLMAGNRDSAAFLAGGEFPVPAAVTTTNGQPFITVVFKEFGVRLAFTPELLGDSLVKLHVRPEVSSLDYTNAVVLSGIRIPALRTRRLESTVDVPTERSLVISGLLNDERQRVRQGVPGLMNLPVLGNLFSSTRWQNSETELLVIVTPTVVDPTRPRPQDAPRLLPDAGLPAREVVAPRLADPAAVPAPRPLAPAARAGAPSATPAPRQP